MGPTYAAQNFVSRVEERLPRILASEERVLAGSTAADVTYTVTLYGSLAQTGKGHLTDAAILSVLGESRTTILWEKDKELPGHNNGMLFVANLPMTSGPHPVYAHVYYSVGGGAIRDGRLSDLNSITAVAEGASQREGCPLEANARTHRDSQVSTPHQTGNPANVLAPDLAFLAGLPEEPEIATGDTGSPYKDFDSFNRIVEYCGVHQLDLAEFVFSMEDPGLRDYLLEIWDAMRASVAHGLAKSHPVEAAGSLLYPRKAYIYNKRALTIEDDLLSQAKAENDSEDRGTSPASTRRLESLRKRLLIQAFSLAVSEENGSASGDIVTAPTCGACGVVPGLFYYYQREFGLSDTDMASALAVGGLVGNIAKCYGSISGAEAGCQAEVGVATSMAAAGVVHLLFRIDGTNPHECLGRYLKAVEFAAVSALEHQLGLTCDPVRGLVVVPCIERNGFAALRADDCAETAYQGLYDGLVSYDEVVETMVVTGRALPTEYRESSLGGLAKTYCMDETSSKVPTLKVQEAKELSESAGEKGPTSTSTHMEEAGSPK